MERQKVVMGFKELGVHVWGKTGSHESQFGRM